MYRLVPESGGVHAEKLWSSPLDTCHGGFVSADDVIYASAYRWFKGWTALEGATGQELYRTTEIAKGSVLWADQRLYCLSEEGDMCLMEPGQTGFTFRGRFRPFAESGKEVWAHPVILNRRLYLRHHDTLACYDIAR